jgi:hypothetical protein
MQFWINPAAHENAVVAPQMQQLGGIYTYFIHIPRLSCTAFPKKTEWSPISIKPSSRMAVTRATTRGTESTDSNLPDPIFRQT